MGEGTDAMQTARRLEAEQLLTRAHHCYQATVNLNTVAFRRPEGMGDEVFEQRKQLTLMMQKILNQEFHLLMDQACNAWRVYRNPPKPKIEYVNR